MKHLLLILFLLQSVAFFAQTEDFHLIKIKPNEASGYFIHAFHGFYIDSVIDNRPIKTSHFGIVKKGLTGARRLKAKFENDSINTQIKALFNEYTTTKEAKIPVIAVINFFEIGEFQANAYSEEGFAYLDIDYFLKNTDGERKKVGHYHGKLFESLGADVTNSHPGRIFYILKKSLNTIKISDYMSSFRRAKFTDTSYVPQEGFYRSFIDYQYNTPIKTQKKYSVTYEKYKEKCFVKTKADSLYFNMFGYSDGLNFYTHSENNWTMQTYNIAKPKGRFLFMKDAVLDLSSDEALGKAVLGAAFGIAGSISAGTNKTGNVIFDLTTGKAIRVESNHFLNFLNQEDEAIYKEYQVSKRKQMDAKIAIEKINVLYHNKQLKTK